MPQHRIGTIENMQQKIIADLGSPTHRRVTDALGDRFGSIGYGIIALFLVCWIASILFHRWQRAADAPAR